MPVIQLPLSKGLGTDQDEADWLDSLPVNMLAVPKGVLNASGYMRSWPGLVQTDTVPGLGRGGLFNVTTSSIFRINGAKLQEVIPTGSVVTRADVPGTGYVPTSHSKTTTAFVADGALYYWNGTERTEIQNWAEGEKTTSTPNNIWTPDFGTDRLARIPDWTGTGGFTISVDVTLSNITDKQYIFGGLREVGIFIESGSAWLKLTEAGAPEQIQSVSSGNNSISITSEDAPENPLNVVGFGLSAGGSNDFWFDGEIRNLDLRESDIVGDDRLYPLTISRNPSESAPTTTTIEDTRGGRDGTLTVLSSPPIPWVVSSTTPDPTLSPATNFDLNGIIDVVRFRGRYVFIQEGKGTFGVTDIENEQRIDFTAPFYSAESFPDDALAVDRWRDFVAVFGRYSVEFFRLTGNAERIYAPEQSLTIQAGTMSRTTVCRYQDNFVSLGGPEGEPPGIFFFQQGSYKELSTRRIQKVLRTYNQEQLESAYLEPFKYDAHDGFVVHLPNHVFVYDPAAQGAEWKILKTDTAGDLPYRGIYHIFDDNRGEWTAADKRAAILTELDWTVGSHVGEKVEYILDTPMIQARDAILYDFEVDTVSGRTMQVERIALSATYDGITHNQEAWIEFNSPVDFTTRIFYRNLGRVQNNIGFRLRWVTSNTTAISNFRVRAE